MQKLKIITIEELHCGAVEKLESQTEKAVRKRANLVRHEKCCKTSLSFQKLASMPPITDLPRFGLALQPVQAPPVPVYPTLQDVRDVILLHVSDMRDL